MTDAKENNRCKYCNEVIMGDFHKEEDCAMKGELKQENDTRQSKVQDL